MKTRTSRKTLIDEFLAHQLSEHTEPERRGEGFPLAKAKAAALLAVTRLRAEEVAKEVGTSGYVVRNWLSEEPFQRQMARDARDFRAWFRERAQRRAAPVAVTEALSEPAETAISNEALAQGEPLQLMAAARQLAAIEKVKATAPAENRWSKKRSEKLRSQTARSDEPTLLKLAGERETLTVEEALREIRHRLHSELERLLPPDANEEREALSFLCGCIDPPQTSTTTSAR